MKINQSAVRDFALTCSVNMRAGKFKRVSQGFVEEIEAELEAIIRSIGNGNPPDRMPAIPEPADFIVQSKVLPQVITRLNHAIARVIARKTHRHPTVGKTLMPLS